MPKRKLPRGEELEKLGLYVAHCSKEELEALAQKLGFGYGASLISQLNKRGYRRERQPVNFSEAPVYDDPPLITEPRMLMLTDPHFCFHNAEFMNRCLDLADTWSLDVLLWGGDYLDFKVFGRFVVWPEEMFENELLAFGQAQTACAQVFTRQIAVKGNHEERLDRFLSRLINAARLAKLIDRCKTLELSNYHFAIYQPEGISYNQRWLLGHPDDYSRIPARTATDIALNNQCNCGCGHNHYLGMAKCKDGIHWGIDSGHCTDVPRHDYKALRMSSRPTWATGALALVEGHPILLTQDSDWNALKKLYGG